MKVLFIILSLVSSCAPFHNVSDSKIIGGAVVPGNPEQQGEYSSTFGISILGIEGSCMGSRIGDNKFVTAAHCLNGVTNGKEVNLYASNNRLFTLPIVNIKIAPGYVSGNLDTLDLATFSLAFYVSEQKVLFDRFVAVASIREKALEVGEKVNIAGYGCEEANEVGPLLSECSKPGSFARFKVANSTVHRVPQNSKDIYLQLNNSVTDSHTNGIIGEGDSGGAVFDSNKQIVAINRGHDGIIIGTYSLGKTLHAWLGQTVVKTFLSDFNAPSSSFFEGKILFYQYQLDKNGIPFGGTVKDEYKGFVKNGMRNGEGTMKSYNGRRYTGPWVNDIKEGLGETWFEEANTRTRYFKGIYVGGVPNGEGLVIYKSGDTYNGGFLKGLEHGTGTQTFDLTGDSESGQWIAGKREGRFVFTTKDGKTFHVDYQNDVRVSELIPI